MPRASLMLLVGSGYGGEDILQKTPWASAMEGVALHVCSRIDPQVHWAKDDVPVRGLSAHRLRASWAELEEAVGPLDVAYHDPRFNEAPSEEEVETFEAWLNTSLAFAGSLDRRFFDRRTGADARPPDVVRRAAWAWGTYFRDCFSTTRAGTLITTLEDDVFSVMAVLVARRMGIPVVGLQVGRFAGRGLMLCQEFTDVLEWQTPRKPFEEIVAAQPQGISGEAQRRTAGYWDLGALPKRVGDATFARTYRSFFHRTTAAYPLEAAILPRLSLFREARRHAARVLRRYRMQIVADGKPPEEPFILYPLHYEDDAQLTFREPFLDQMALIRAIVRSLPTGHKLYVKPHPHYGGTDQRPKELVRLARHPDVRLLEPTLPSQALLQAARAVVTLNSTVGFEALLRGVPVVTLGDDFYCHPGPCDVVRDLKRLPEALLAAVKRPHGATPESRRFVETVYANTIPVQGEDVWPGHYVLTAEDGRRVARALTGALGSLGTATSSARSSTKASA